MHRTISKKIKRSKKFTKKKLKHKDGVIIYYHKGGVKKSQLTRLRAIIFQSMFTDITNILCGTTSPDIIHSVLNLTKDTELLGSFAREGQSNLSDQNYFFKGFQNYFLNNDNAIYEAFVNGIIKEAMKKYNLELLGFNYIGNENDFKLKQIQDVDYDDWKRIGKRINILIRSNAPNATCEFDYLKEIRTGTNWFELSSDNFNFDIQNINGLVFDKFIEAFHDLGVKDITLNKIKEKGLHYIFSKLLPPIIKQVEKELGVEGATENIMKLFNGISVLGNQHFIDLVKNIFNSIKGIASKDDQRGGGKFTVVNIAYKIESCITFAKFIKQGIEACIEGHTLSKSITSTASNDWAMDAHQLNSLLSTTNNYNSYDYKADIINKIMVVYKKKHHDSFKIKLAESSVESHKPSNLIQLMLDIRTQSTNVIEQGGFEEVYYPKKDLVLYLDKQPELDPREELKLFLLKTKANIYDTTNDLEFERIYRRFTSGTVGDGVIEIRRISDTDDIYLNEIFLKKIGEYFEADDLIKEYLNKPELTFHDDDDEKRNNTMIFELEEFKKLFVELQALSSTQNDFDDFINGLKELSEFIESTVIQVFNNNSTTYLISEKLCNEKFYSELCMSYSGPLEGEEEEELEEELENEEELEEELENEEEQLEEELENEEEEEEDDGAGVLTPRTRRREAAADARAALKEAEEGEEEGMVPHGGGSAVKTRSKKTNKRSILFRKSYNKKLNKILNFKMPFFKKIQFGGGDKAKIKLIKITNGNTINYTLINKVIFEALDINIENSEIDTILNNLNIYKYIDQKTFLHFIMLIKFNNENKTTKNFLKDTIDDIQKPNNFTRKGKKQKRSPIWKTIFIAVATGTLQKTFDAVSGLAQGVAAVREMGAAATGFATDAVTRMATPGPNSAMAIGLLAATRATRRMTRPPMSPGVGGGDRDNTDIGINIFFLLSNEIFTTLKNCSNKIYTFDFNKIDERGSYSGYIGGRNRRRAKKTKRHKIKGPGKKTKKYKDIEYKDIEINFSNRKYPEFLYYTLKHNIDAINKQDDFLVQDTEGDKNIIAAEKLYKIFTSYDTYIFENTIRFKIENPKSDSWFKFWNWNAEQCGRRGGGVNPDLLAWSVGQPSSMGHAFASRPQDQQQGRGPPPPEAESGAPEPKTQQELLDSLFGLIFDGIEVIGNLNDTHDNLVQIAKVAEVAFQLIGALRAVPRCQVQANAAGATGGAFAGPFGGAVAAAGVATYCMTSALMYSYNEIKNIGNKPEFLKLKVFGGIFSLLNNYRKTISNKIGNIGRKYSIYQYSPLLLKPDATPDEIENQKKEYYKKLLLLNSHLSFILDTNYYIHTILEANNISADIFNELCDDREVKRILHKIYLVFADSWSGGEGQELPQAITKIVTEILQNLPKIKFNELYNISGGVLSFIFNLILFKNISQYIFFVVFGADMSSYSLQIALFKSIFKESSELQLSLYLKLIENTLNNYFSKIMDCIIKIYIDNKITNYIPIPLKMSEEEEKRLKTKQKKHMEQKLQEKKGHEFTQKDRELLEGAVGGLLDKALPRGTVPVSPPSPPRVHGPQGSTSTGPNGEPTGNPTQPLPSGSPHTTIPTAEGDGSDTGETLKPGPNLNDFLNVNDTMYNQTGAEYPFSDLIKEGIKQGKNFIYAAENVAQGLVHKNPDLNKKENELQEVDYLGGGVERTESPTIEINEPKPLILTMRLQNPLKDFLQFPDLDKMDWENNYDGELYKVANYIYNVISNEKNLETRTFMISTIYHNYLSELITTL